MVPSAFRYERFIEQKSELGMTIHLMAGLVNLPFQRPMFLSAFIDFCFNPGFRLSISEYFQRQIVEIWHWMSAEVLFFYIFEAD